MLKVGIIGASGMAGSAIYKEASSKPTLAVTGIVRDETKAQQVLGKDAKLLVGDVLTMDNGLLMGFDVIVDALGTSPEEAGQQVTLAQKLVGLATNDHPRLLFILGAGSLYTGADHHLAVEDIAKDPAAAAWINIPKLQLKELEYLQTVRTADWMGISPSLEFVPGPATRYVLGGNDLLFDDHGMSRVTSGTMAKVIVHEILNPHHHQERITVINAI
ncbi:NAD(P)-dependent oxidoreductase [Limosilactobacillus caccae]|uniref:NAD(P)-dependent oxidoreductase n=1 Tax=Limosilactobacillus caccae TaxID=1926284 RepID=UPI0009713698|nr:NAD(P)H-binding protein [Limosilactobacillus caccae]